MKHFPKIRNLYWLPLLLSPLLLARCGSGTLGGSEVGNPTAISLKVVGTDSGAPASGKLLSDGVTLNSARIVLSKMRFRPLSACQSSSAADTSDINFEGPYVADLLSNSSLPDLGAAQIPSGLYCRIEIEIHKLSDNELPSGIGISDPIVDRSLYVTGTTGDGTDFTLAVDVGEQFKLENSNGFEISATASSATYFIAFDLPFWFSGIDFSSADLTSGVIVIDKDNNRALLDLIVEQVKLSADLFEDLNHDGSLGSNEHNPSDVLASGQGM